MKVRGVELDRERLKEIGDRPLDPLPTLKWKIGAAVFASTSSTVFVFWAAIRWLDVWPSVAGLLAMVVALVFVRLLVRGVTTPLRDMAEAARAMAKGDYGRRVETTSRDEVGELARAFNAMAAELAEVDRMRRDLVANVSHELRTPISALQVVLENLVDGVEPPAPDTLRTMLKQVERLGRLVRQLLDLSKLESGAVPLQRCAFDLMAVLEDAAAEARLHTTDVEVTLEVTPEVAGTGLATDGDPERIHQVVANLLENALRHTPSGRPVVLRARRDEPGSSVVFEVCDEGPGIADDDADRVFERFYRADAARASASGGAGLGLAIARWIVDLHGGSIRAERNTPQGCRMVVGLPAAHRTMERVHH